MKPDCYEVSGLSMTGILEPGDFVKLVPGPFERGNLVVFNDGYGLQIKQVIGIPNDPIYVDGDKLRVCGSVYDLREPQRLCWLDWIPEDNRIPGKSLFVSGTIPDSIDSKQKGFIHYQSIIGKAEKM